MKTNTKRIEYIDSVKGICILLIVASHLGISEPWPYSYAIRVPLFFVVSGFFIDTSPGMDLCVFLRKRINSLMIPFLIFYSLSYLLFYFVDYYSPQLNTTGAKGILDCIYQYEWFNGPLWFLPCLFFSQMIFLTIIKLSRMPIIAYCIILLIGSVGYILSEYDIYISFGLGISLVAVPFALIGKLLNQYNLFGIENDRIILLIIITTYILGYI